jgi:hypothetical protein
MFVNRYINSNNDNNKQREFPKCKFWNRGQSVPTVLRSNRSVQTVQLSVHRSNRSVQTVQRSVLRSNRSVQSVQRSVYRSNRSVQTIHRSVLRSNLSVQTVHRSTDVVLHFRVCTVSSERPAPTSNFLPAFFKIAPKWPLTYTPEKVLVEALVSQFWPLWEFFD